MIIALSEKIRYLKKVAQRERRLKKGVRVTGMKNKITMMSLVYSKFRPSLTVSAGRSGPLMVMTVQFSGGLQMEIPVSYCSRRLLGSASASIHDNGSLTTLPNALRAPCR